MSIWILLQIVLNVFLLIGFAICAIKVFKDKEDDPRLNQGLRLLQSKISILEDLSDHTENQVKQLMNLLDKKLHEVRHTLGSVNQHISEVDRSIEKSKKMADIIREEIPHKEIVEKDTESRYIRAAKMAHAGESTDTIVRTLGLPKGEVELIAKINRNKCIYESKESMPSIREELFSKNLEMPKIQTNSSNQTKLDFHQAVQEHKDKEQSEFESIKLG